MMSKKIKIFGFVFFAIAFVLLAVMWFSHKETSYVFFPRSEFEIYAVNDSLEEGFSTSEMSLTDSTVTASIVIHSGKAFPFAGIGFNLQSRNNRPTVFFDLSQYDSMAVNAVVGRMRSLKFRVLTDDPGFTEAGEYTSFRLLEQSVPAKTSYTELKASLSDFKTAERWLVAHGMDEDNGVRHFDRAVFLEIVSGEGTLMGFPDELEIKSLRLWGENHSLKNTLFLVSCGLGILFLVFLFFTFQKKEEIQILNSRMENVSQLLKNTDKSLAEIALELNEKSVGKLEKDFYKVYGMKPLDYRRKNV